MAAIGLGCLEKNPDSGRGRSTRGKDPRQQKLFEEKEKQEEEGRGGGVTERRRESNELLRVGRGTAGA